MNDRTNAFIQLPFNVFIAQFPEAINMFPPAMLKELMSDSNYIIRLNGDKIEVGYSEDEWNIN